MTASSDQPRGTLRTLLFRIAAIFVGISPFVALETGLHVAGWEPSADLRVDPFIEFHGTQPLFAPDESGTRFRIVENRMPFFRPESFSAVKDENEFRIFVLGGSTVQGRPYSIESSFTTWLELALQSADPIRNCEVVNCGGVSYASYRLVPILNEIQSYQPDLVVLCTGHNEFLEDRTYANVKRIPSSLSRATTRIAGLKSLQLIRQFVGDSAERNEKLAVDKTKPEMSAEVDALLDYRNGLEAYHRDKEWQAGVIQHFAFNLRRLIRIAQEAEVPMLLVNPAVNQKDCPPFKMADCDGLSESERSRAADLWSQAKSLDTDAIAKAIALLEEALAINDEHAGLHFHLAQCYLHIGKADLAKHHFNRARDEDICPLRILSSMQHVIAEVAHETGTPVLDVQREFEELSDDGITGDYLFLDHVHPTISGHQEIATMLSKKMIECELLVSQTGWEVVRQQRFEDHLQSLDAVYFEHGAQRLEGLRLWTQGRAKKTRGG